MISMELLEQVADEVKENIYHDTGISLNVIDMSFEVSGNTISMTLWGFDFYKVECDEEVAGYEPADMGILLIEGIDGDLKSKVVGLKILQLEKQSLPKLIDETKARLVQKGVEPSILDALDFSIEDMGYDYHHWEIDEESEQGFPVIAFGVSNLDGLDFSYPLNIYYPDESVDDIYDLIDKLYRELKSKNTGL